MKWVPCYQKVVQAPRIEEDLLKAAAILLKISSKGPRRRAEEVCQYHKSSVVTASDYREKVQSLKMCSKIFDIITGDRLFGIGMTGATISSTMHNGAEEKQTFYVKNTQAVIKRQLTLSKLDQISFRPPVQRDEMM